MSTYQYKISPQGLNKLINKATLKSAITMLAVVACVFGMMIMQGSVNAGTLQFMIPVMLVILGFGIFSGRRKNKAMLSAYTFTLSDNMLLREEAPLPSVSFYYDDVATIERNRKGALIITAKDGTLIIVPAEVENFNDVEERLTRICAITTEQKDTLLKKYPMAFTLLPLAMMVGAFAIPYAPVAAVCGVGFVAVGAWCIYTVQTSKYLDKRMKRKTWLLLLPMISVILSVIFKLVGLV